MSFFASSLLGGLIRYEFLMQFRRKALWIALGIAWALTALIEGLDDLRGVNLGIAAELLLPITAGYFLSDRLYRDNRLGTDQLIGTSRVGQGQYVWGKYLGTVGATLAATITLIAGLTALLIPFNMMAPGENYFTLIEPPLIVIVPAYLFIGAFCLALPALLPLRIYQILFSCYWLWAFQLRFPSVKGTPLSPTGEYSLMLLFRDQIRSREFHAADWSASGYFLVRGPFGWTFEDTPAMALLNITILLGLGLAALLALHYYLNWKEAHR